MVYQEIYLSQKNRPNMDFIDLIVGDIHGLRIRELREAAKKKAVKS
jgi:hypothetical protein